MNYPRKYLTTAIIFMSIILMVGCSSSPAPEQDKNSVVLENEQTQQQEPVVVQTIPIPQEDVPKAWKEISASEADALINTDKTVQIIDLRSGYLYVNKHIPDAMPILPERLEARMGEIDKTKPVLLYDETGRKKAPAAAELLTKNGYTNVNILKGGMEGWTFGVEP